MKVEKGQTYIFDYSFFPKLNIFGTSKCELYVEEENGELWFMDGGLYFARIPNGELDDVKDKRFIKRLTLIK